jgi:2-methylcitrate dehydratase
MIEHELRAHPSSARLAREDQLAWKLAAVATDPVEVSAEVADMVINRVIDDAAAAAAALARGPVRAAREQALRHPSSPGAAVWGAAPGVRVSRSGRHGRMASQCASWTSITPSWPPTTLIRATTSRRCWRWRSTPAGPARTSCAASRPPTRCRLTWLRESACTSTRSTTSRTWARRPPRESAPARARRRDPLPGDRAGTALHHADPAVSQGRDLQLEGLRPAFAGKTAIEAIDRAMRGQGALSPIYEGDDGVIAWLLGGPDAVYTVPLRRPARLNRRSWRPTPRSTPPSTRRRR